MIECNSCGAALRFDIVSQKMMCTYCSNQYDPETVDTRGSNAEETVYEVKVFTCPQCGGRLGTTEDSAAEFCSFCGSPVILESRMSKMERPKYIIPFMKTKEEGKKALQKHLRGSFFLPRQFRNFEVEKMRGIYMPYWSYDIEQNNKVSLPLDADDASGLQYKANGKVDATYHGVLHDAAKGFADRISEDLAPYDNHSRRKFSPAYVSGFFSDVKDVKPEKYKQNAMDFANKQTADRFITKAEKKSFKKLVVKKDTNLNTVFDTRIKRVESTLLPVWFLSYRKGKRVAYAAVNGQTGTVVSDLPVSVGKVLFLALLITIPIFALLNTQVSMRATTLMTLALCMLALTNIFYSRHMAAMKRREENPFFESQLPKKKGIRSIIRRIPSLVKVVIGILVFCFVAVTDFRMVISFWVGCAAAISLPIWGLKKKTMRKKFLFPWGYPLLFFGAVVCTLNHFVNPISDAYYYVATIIALAAILFTLLHMCFTLNILSTRPLPQLKHRGGEEYE